ncbi:MAG: complex I subunit 1 family protein [Thermodesulfobacteriota bacterium]
MIVVLILAPIIGGLLMGLDRKLTARIHGRIGPPLLQPFYDVFKLLGKQPVVLNRVKTVYVYLHLVFMLMVFVLLTLGQDMLMALFAHAFSTIALVLGGMSVRSPYSRIGSQRKIMQMLAYEPVLVLLVVGIALKNWSFMARDVIYMNQPLLTALPLVFLAYLAAMIIKLEKSPFDVSTSHHAHQEIVKGVTLEFTGPYLALIEITHFYEVALLFGVIVMFWATNLAVGLPLAAACFLFQIVVDNAFARLTTMWMVRFMWTLPMILAVGNIAWFYV